MNLLWIKIIINLHIKNLQIEYKIEPEASQSINLELEAT